MKKLMIAAAAAAMIGGAFAAGYDFTASVKTTCGKQGKNTTTYYVNLGQANDLSGTYWWQDSNYLGRDWSDEKSAKKVVGDWVKIANKTTTQAEWDLTDLADFLNTVNYTFSTDKENGDNDYGIYELYKGKIRWCYSFSFKVTESDCYRVATSRKFKGIVDIATCCDASTWEFKKADQNDASTMLEFLGFDDETDAVCFNEKLFNRFGGVQLAKATKVEYVGTIGNDDDLANKFNWAIAGQGAYDTKLDIVKNISGNIVGILENPDCENCCDDNQVATVFDCANGDTRVTPGDDATYDGTAAYGTWSIKYNKKY